MTFDDFHDLPLCEAVLPVPLRPDHADLNLADLYCALYPDNPAARWHVEAVRWRMRHPGAPLRDGIASINAATMAALLPARKPAASCDTLPAACQDRQPDISPSSKRSSRRSNGRGPDS